MQQVPLLPRHSHSMGVGTSRPVSIACRLPRQLSATLSRHPQRAFEGVVVEKKGFKWVNERPDAKSENDEKWGWIGEKAGAWCATCNAFWLLALAMLFGWW